MMHATRPASRPGARRGRRRMKTCVLRGTNRHAPQSCCQRHRRCHPRQSTAPWPRRGTVYFRERCLRSLVSLWASNSRAVHGTAMARCLMRRSFRSSVKYRHASPTKAIPKHRRKSAAVCGAWQGAAQTALPVRRRSQDRPAPAVRLPLVRQPKRTTLAIDWDRRPVSVKHQ